MSRSTQHVLHYTPQTDDSHRTLYALYSDLNQKNEAIEREIDRLLCRLQEVYCFGPT